MESSDIIKGYEVNKGEYITLEPADLEAIAIESKRTIEIDEFVPRKEIDELSRTTRIISFLMGRSEQAFVRQEGMVAIAARWCSPCVSTSFQRLQTVKPRLPP